MTSINAIAAAEHRADLHRAAARAYPHLGPQSSRDLGPARSVVLRPAHADDGHVVAGLAQLDDAPELEGEVLIALIDGNAVAALSLLDGRVVANPFVRTENAVALLRLRAKHLSGASPRRRFRPILRPRFT